MRTALVVLMVIHGLTHLLGFAKEWRLAPVPQIQGTTRPAPWPRILGALWMLAVDLWLVTAVAYALGFPWAWVPGAGALVVSQALIFGYWRDAKWGTLANALLLLPLLTAAGRSHFEDRVREDLAALLVSAPTSAAPPIVEADLTSLPAPVARWLRRAGVVGRPRARSAWLLQAGGMRTAPAGPFMPAVAEQAFRFDEPAFLWHVHVTMMSVLPIEGRDSYGGGRGRMLITAAGLAPIVDAQDAAIDEGSMLRFLTELVWTPSAMFAPFIAWAPVDEHRARATMTWRGVTASADFTVDDQGRVTHMEAERFYGGGPGAKRERWVIRCSAWRRFDGVEVPTEGEVVWKLAAGDFPYYRWTLTDLRHDPRALPEAPLGEP